MLSLSHWLTGRCVLRPHTWPLTSELLLKMAAPTPHLGGPWAETVPTTPQSGVGAASRVQKRCARHCRLKPGAAHPGLPRENRVAPRDSREAACPRTRTHACPQERVLPAGAYLSPICEERIRHFYPLLLNPTLSRSAASKNTGQEDARWGATRKVR